MTSVSPVSNTAYVQDALKYVNGMTVSKTGLTDDIFGAFKSIPSFAFMQGGFFAGGQILKKTDKEVTSIFGKTKYARAGVKGLTTTLGNMKTLMYKNEALTSLLKANKGFAGAEVNLKAVRGVEEAIKAGKITEVESLIKKASSADDLLKGVESLNNVAKGAETAAKATKVSKFSKALTWLKGTSIGGKVVNSSVVQGAKGLMKKAGETTVGKAISKGAGKFSKAFKTSGAGLNLIIEGGLAVVTDIIPAFKMGGFKEGVKQTAKSAVKVGASTAGWVGGSKVGAAAGSAIGTAICPGIGTAIGGFIGDIVGGLIGSAVAGKVAEKVVGEDYTDKVQNQAVEQQAVMVAQDASTMSELNQTVYAMIQEDMADDGKLTDDSKKMLAYLEQGAGTVNTMNLANNYGASQWQTSTSSSGLDELIQRIHSGDASVYDVPPSVLEASAKGQLSDLDGGFANNYTVFGMENPYLNKGITTNGSGTFDFYAA